MTKKRDSNNFINLIITKLELAKNFHQRVALSITSKSILNCATLKFYIRKRYKKLFLYTRMDKSSFGTRIGSYNVIRDVADLIPELEIESIKGHLKGWILEIKPEHQQALVKFLKLIALLAHPDNFYLKTTKSQISFWNYADTSDIPIHILFQENQLLNLRSAELLNTFFIRIQKYNAKRNIKTNTSNHTTDINDDDTTITGLSSTSDDSTGSSDITTKTSE